MAEQCLSDVVLQASVETTVVVPGLMATAVVLGVVLGVTAAALLFFLAFLPRLQKKNDSKWHPGKRDSTLKKGNHSKKHSSTKKKKTENEAPIGEILLEDDDGSAHGDIAAFALRAKVIYPINQKFRPLADGASNPSLHETTKKAALPNQMMEGSCSSSLDSLSQEDKDECSSSTTVHSATSDDRFYEKTFVKVTCFPEVLTCESFDVKLCLYSLRLKGLPILDNDLRQEKHLIFVQVLRLYLTDLLMKKKIDGELFRNILSAQESDLQELEEKFHSRMANIEIIGADDSAYQTLEDISRKEKEYSDYIIQNMESFWKQLDKVHRFLLEQAKCTSDEARTIMMGVTEQLITVEGLLSESQDLQIMDFQEKIIRWEHMAKVADSLKSQIQHESEARLNALSATLEQLITQRKLSVRQKEHQLTDLLRAFWEEVTRYNNECLQQTKELIRNLLKSRNELMDKLHRAQKGEQVIFLNNVQQTADPLDFLKDYHRLLEKQRETWCDMEEEDDCKATEAVADLCKELYSGSSQAFEKLVKELLLKTLPTITTLSSRECELLRQEMRQNLMLELEKADHQRKRGLKLFQELLLQEKEVWTKEHALSAVLQNHLSEKHENILQDAINRLSGLSEECTAFVLQRHRLLLDSVLRMIALRNVSMATQTQMKVCRKKSLLQELGEQHLHKEMESRIFEKEQRVEEESNQARAECHQQLLAELQEGLQLLQQHMEQVIGQVLVRHAQQEAAKSILEDGNKELKERLIETAVESVFVTSNSVNNLVQSFFEEIQRILQNYEQAKDKRLKAVQEKAENSRMKKKKELTNQSMKEKLSNVPLTATSGLRQRVLLKKDMLLDLSNVQQNRLDYLKQKKLVMCQMGAQLDNQLKEAEQKFMSNLAAMAKVRFTDGKQLLRKTNQSDTNMKTKSKNLEPREEEDSGEFNATNQQSYRETPQAFRYEQYEQQTLQEIDQRKKLQKAAKKKNHN